MIAKSIKNNVKAVEVNIQRIRLLCGTKKYHISTVVAAYPERLGFIASVFLVFFFVLGFFFCLLTP
jgi:hypothetical protein